MTEDLKNGRRSFPGQVELVGQTGRNHLDRSDYTTHVYLGELLIRYNNIVL